MSTFRIIQYLLGLFVLAWLVIFISRMPGDVSLTLGSARYTVGSAYVALFIVLASLSLWSVMAIVLYFWRLPQKQVERQRARRAEKARLVLGETYMALARDDLSAARKLIKRAQAGLPDDELAMMISADLAWRDGDFTLARQQFDAIKATHPQAAYQGQFTMSLAQNDVPRARAALEAGLRDNKSSRWALQASFDLALHERSWLQAQAVIGQMQRAGLLTKLEARRYSAMLMLEDLRQVRKGLTPRMQLQRASKIIRMAPSFVPAISALVEALVADGQIKKARLRLAAAWAQAPHADLAILFLNLHTDLPLDEQAARAQKFVGRKRDETESLLLRAHLTIRARRWAQAEQLLSSLCEDQPTRLVCEYMAELKRGQDDAGAAREWLSRALNAPSDPCWHDDGVPQKTWTAIGPVSKRFDNVVWGVPNIGSGLVLNNTPVNHEKNELANGSQAKVELGLSKNEVIAPSS